MIDEEAMGRWFAKVCQPQLARYNQRMADAAPYRNAPCWVRERTNAQNEFENDTREAAQLYHLAMADLEVLGEISEATDYALTQFNVGQAMQLEATP